LSAGIAWSSVGPTRIDAKRCHGDLPMIVGSEAGSKDPTYGFRRQIPHKAP